MESQKEISSKNQLNKDLKNVTDTSNLSEMFDMGFEMYNNVNESDEPISNPKLQSTIKHTINIFENTTKLVSLINMFSNNENFEEISTENIKYLLLPALLGILTIKICGLDNRIHIVDVAEIYFIDFLKRLKSYGLIEIEIPEIWHNDDKEETTNVHHKSNAELIIDMVNVRNTKIQRYQNQKELEKKLSILKTNLNNPNIDDETKREYFVILIKIFANQAIDELTSLASERPILEHMKKISLVSNNKLPQKLNTTTDKLQPIIITRDAVQKKVFGIGYPSLPILTVQEFYDQKVKSGEWSEQNQTNQINSKGLQNIASSAVDENFEKDIEEELREQQIDKDDSETLARARIMDDYKDVHRRGWGNRANRS